MLRGTYYSQNYASIRPRTSTTHALHSFYIQARQTMSAMLNIATTLYTYIAHAATYNSLPMHMNVTYSHSTTHYTLSSTILLCTQLTNTYCVSTRVSGGIIAQDVGMA